MSVTWCPVDPDCTMPMDADGECEAHPTKNRDGKPDSRPTGGRWRLVEQDELGYPPPGDDFDPIIDAIVGGLGEHALLLRDLGHSYAYLDANARYYVAHVAVRYLEARGFEIRRKEP